MVEEEPENEPERTRGEGKRSRKILASDGEMTFLEHLEDLRFTLARCIGAFALGVIVLVFFLPGLTDLLRLPFVWAQGAADPDSIEGLLSLKPMGVFTVMLQVLFLGGLATSLPFILFSVAQFIAPALTEKEKKVLIPGLITGFFLFLAGVAFSFFVILPAALRVSITFNEMFGLEILWGASEYYTLVVWLSVLMGALFEFPMILVMLVHLGILTADSLRRQRRLVAIGLLVLSALITPTGDPITLIIMTAPLYGLYEVAIVVGARMARRKPEEDGDPGEEEYEWDGSDWDEDD